MKKVTTHASVRISLLRSGAAGIAFLLISFAAGSQILDSQNKVTIPLSDGTQVTLYGKAKPLSDDFLGEYYYLPTNLRLSKRVDGTPEFLFLKYTTEARADAGGVQGALMHFLMEWGLTPQQETELQTKLTAKIKDLAKSSPQFKKVLTPKVMGPVNLRSDTEESFRIISGTLTNEKFTPNLVSTGKAPLLPGSKIAVASILEKNGAQLLAATFEKNRSITDVSINLRFRYEVLVPRVEGRITVDWSKMETFYQKIQRDYTHTDVDDGTMPASNSLKDDVITDTEKDSIFAYLRETNIVKIDLDIQEVDNPIAQEVVKAYMEYFIGSLTDKEFVQSEAPKPIEQGEKYQPSEDLYEYHFSKTKIETKFSKRKEEYNLRMRLPMIQEMTVTENLASWYDGVKSNDKCVASVNLNDPFFQHRDINLILDMEAEEMFGKEVNYVTVNVRKNRSSGNPFEDHVTIDRDFLKAHGVKATMTYARGEDKNPDVYQYKAQWSLKGGNLFPENPQWIVGDWQGVTLAPPVKPRKIEFESNLEEMTELGITRATLQLRYMKFNKEFETNIPITVSKGQPLAEETIFTDRNQQGYAYRLVLTHKDKGKMALDWDAKINDDYIYASIPEKLKENDPDYLNKVIKAAEVVITPGADGQVSKGNEILNKFKDVLDVIK